MPAVSVPLYDPSPYLAARDTNAPNASDLSKICRAHYEGGSPRFAMGEARSKSSEGSIHA
jgi:hypothetical protein